MEIFANCFVVRGSFFNHRYCDVLHCYILPKRGCCTNRIVTFSVRPEQIAAAINKHKPLKWGKNGTNIRVTSSLIRVEVPDPSATPKRTAGKQAKNQKEYFERVQQVKSLLPGVVIAGYPDCSRAMYVI